MLRYILPPPRALLGALTGVCLFPSFVLNGGGAWSVVVAGTAIVVVVIMIAAVVVVNDVDDEVEAKGPIYDVCSILKCVGIVR